MGLEFLGVVISVVVLFTGVQRQLLVPKALTLGTNQSTQASQKTKSHVPGICFHAHRPNYYKPKKTGNRDGKQSVVPIET